MSRVYAFGFWIEVQAVLIIDETVKVTVVGVGCGYDRRHPLLARFGYASVAVLHSFLPAFMTKR